MEQRVSLITIGVDDLARSRDFYERLGWRTGAAPGDDIVFFQALGMVVALWSREELLKDMGKAAAPPAPGAIGLAYNVGSPKEVDAVIEEARGAGATITREPAQTFWGGYSAAFADPDGHPWEVAHNPHWRLDADGAVHLG
jgi:uncharacterized protein